MSDEMSKYESSLTLGPDAFAT